MRRILAASLLLPSLFLPAVANASKPMDDASAPTPKVRVSTGVVAPELLGAERLTIPVSANDLPIPADAEVGLTLTVDQNGRPADVKVVKSLSPLWDARVVDAVSHAHFKPGTVSNEPTSVELNLTVSIAK
jgi:TonB family protein